MGLDDAPSQDGSKGNKPAGSAGGPARSCRRRYVAYRLVHCLAIRSCSALLVMYCVAMLPTSGSAAKEAEAGQSGQRSAPRSRGHGVSGHGRKGWRPRPARSRAVRPGAHRCSPAASSRSGQGSLGPSRQTPAAVPPGFQGAFPSLRRCEWAEPGLHPDYCWGWGSSKLVSG